MAAGVASENGRGWILVTVGVPREAEELAGSLLFEAGANGTMTVSETDSRIEIGAYFAESTDTVALRATVGNELQQRGVRPDQIEFRTDFIPDQDWLQKWKEGYEPIQAGEKFLIVPSWKIDSLKIDSLTLDSLKPNSVQLMDLSDADSQSHPLQSVDGRIVILIDPGMAFGTGTHESTRLCLEFIERYWKGGQFLDVGTGTGILAIAAAKLVPHSSVTGIDVDPVAVEVAGENAGINKVTSIHLRVAEPGSLRPSESTSDEADHPAARVECQSDGQRTQSQYDVVVANLTADLIAEVLQDLVALVTANGRLILSGILSEQGPDIEGALRNCGFNIIAKSAAGEWVAFVAQPTR